MDKSEIEKSYSVLTDVWDQAKVQMELFLHKDNKSAGKRYRLLMIELEKLSKAIRRDTLGD